MSYTLMLGDEERKLTIKEMELIRYFSENKPGTKPE
jgi:hypothetical protein